MPRILIFAIATYFFVTPPLLRGGTKPEALAYSPAWLKLLHYQKTLWGFKGTIDFDSFYFSETGKTDPLSEFLATRKALKTGFPKVGLLKLDPICAFPDRMRFFKKVLGEAQRSVFCEGIEYWRKNLPLRSISLVFSTAYSGNPASMLGHTFLKLNLKSSDEAGHSLLDYGASFMALPTDDKGLLYFAKGLTGGYQGAFSVEPFYTHVIGYAYRENRDLWEYEFSFDEQELVLFLEHFWALSYSGFTDYYFLDDNCSSLLLEVFDAVRPELRLSQTRGFFVLPHQTISVVTSKIRDFKVYFVPSQKKEFMALAESLNVAEESTLKRLINRELNIDEVDNKQVIDTLLAYLNYEKSRLDLEDQKEVRNYEDKVLIKRAKLGKKADRREISYIKGNQPDLAHGAKKLALAVVTSPDKQFYLRYRYGLHDLLDNSKGYETYYHINFVDLEAQIDRDLNLASHQLKAIEVMSLNPVDSYFFKPSWHASGGLRSRPQTSCRTCSYLYGKAGIGYAKNLIDRRLLLYGMASLATDFRSIEEQEIFVTPDISLNALIGFSESFKILSTGGRKWQWQPQDDWQKARFFFSLKGQLELGSKVFIFSQLEGEEQVLPHHLIGMGMNF